MRKYSSTVLWLYIQIKPFLFSLLLILILNFIMVFASVGIAIVSKSLIDSAVEHSKFELIRYAVAYLVLILIDVLLGAWKHITSVKVHGNLENRMQARVFSQLSLMQWKAFTQYHSGDLMTRMTSDVRIVSDILVNVITNAITSGFHFLVAFITLCFYDPILAIIAFVSSPLLVLFGRFFGKRLKKSHLQIQETESLCREIQTESIQNMLVVKTFQQEERINKKIASFLEKRLYWLINRAKLSVVGNSVLSLAYTGSYLTAFGWGAYRIFKGTSTLGTMTLFLQLVGQIQGPFSFLASSYTSMISLLASAGRIEELEKVSLENRIEKVQDSRQVGIELDKVSFQYREGEWIFKEQSLYIEPGKLVGIAGVSGEGKTTLIQLLLALYIPTQGHIYFITHDRARIEANADTRAYISYVPQGNTLFSGTISENLRIGCMDATEEQMIQVLKDAGAWEFVEPLSLQLETRIGEKGFGLSEGQIQRLTIARALLRKTPVLILDEATSALDIEHEKVILQAIRHLDYHPTCLIITHRPSALTICDQIFTIKQASIQRETT